jgi:hypothetical protein
MGVYLGRTSACMHTCMPWDGWAGGGVLGLWSPVSGYMGGGGIVVGSMYADFRRIDSNLDALHGRAAETHSPVQ